MNVTSEEAEAAYEAYENADLDYTPINSDALEAAIRAARDAAPPVTHGDFDGCDYEVWACACDATVVHPWSVTDRAWCHVTACPGPHHTLIIGPEVTS